MQQYSEKIEKFPPKLLHFQKNAVYLQRYF